MGIYTTGYRAGARRMVLAYLGEVCIECGEKDIRKLQIAHIIPIKRKKWRDYTDWLDRNNIGILCANCHREEEKEKRK